MPIKDSFTRSVTDGWGTSETSQIWTVLGTAADFDVDGSVGTMVSAAGVGRTARIGSDYKRGEILSRFKISAIPGTSNVESIHRFLMTDTSNCYRTTVSITPGNAIQLRAHVTIANSSTLLGAALTTDLTAAADTWYWMKTFFEPDGLGGVNIYLKVWQFGASEPAYTDANKAIQRNDSVADWTNGDVSLSTFNGASNATITWSFDDFYLNDYGRTAVFKDDFNRADDTAISADWIEPQGAASLGLVSNEVRGTGSISRARYEHYVGGPDMYMQGRWLASEIANVAQANLGVRLSDGDNTQLDMYVFQVQFQSASGVVNFFRTLDGASTNVKSVTTGNALSAATVYLMRHECRMVEPFLDNDFSSGTDESTVTAANSRGFYNAFPIDTVSISGTVVYDDAHPHSGSLGVRLAAAAQSGGNYLEWQDSIPATDEARQRVYGYMSAALSANTPCMGFFTDAAGLVGFVRMNTDRTLSIVDGSSTVLATSSTQLTLDAFFRLEARCKIGAGTGELELRIFTGAQLESMTPTETIRSNAAANGTTQIKRCRVGLYNHGSMTYTLWLDDWKVTSKPLWPGPTSYGHPRTCAELRGLYDIGAGLVEVIRFRDLEPPSTFAPGLKGGFATQKNTTGYVAIDDFETGDLLQAGALAGV